MILKPKMFHIQPSHSGARELATQIKSLRKGMPWLGPASFPCFIYTPPLHRCRTGTAELAAGVCWLHRAHSHNHLIWVQRGLGRAQRISWRLSIRFAREDWLWEKGDTSRGGVGKWDELSSHLTAEKLELNHAAAAHGQPRAGGDPNRQQHEELCWLLAAGSEQP